MIERLSLPKGFAVIAAGIFLLAAAGLGQLSWSRSVAQIEKLGEDYNATLASTMLNATLDGFEPFLHAAATMTPEELVAHPQTTRLRETILRLSKGTRVAKVKIYSPNGRTIFSSDPAQIGAVKGVYARLSSALEGRVASEIEFGEHYVDFDGAVTQADLLSSYLPIRDIHGKDEIIGVFELYTDVTEFKEEIVNTGVIEIAILVLCFGAIYGLLLSTVAAGSRLVARKHEENLELTATAARAEAASQAKSEFLANMSHELRTPLNAIIGFSEIIKNETFGPIQPERYRDYAVDIHSSGQHLLSIIDDVLDLVKIESGTVRLEIAELDLSGTITDAVSTVRGIAEDAGITLSMDLAENLPTVASDLRRIKQILINLLSNAVKFTPEGGRVGVRAIWDPSAEMVEITVADTGMGIAPDDIPVSLSNFGRVDSAIDSKHPGAGLGLPISKRFTEMLGGELVLESRVGHGTKVTIRLPRHGAANGQNQAPQAA